MLMSKTTWFLSKELRSVCDWKVFAGLKMEKKILILISAIVCALIRKAYWTVRQKKKP